MKTFAGVVLGYLAMAIAVFASLSGAFFAVGADRAFQPGSWEVSNLWLGIWFVATVACALLGGVVSRKVGESDLAPKILIGVVLVLGLAHAAMMVGTPAPEGARPADLPMMDAMSRAKSPVWVYFLNPILGALGVYLAGVRDRRSG